QFAQQLVICGDIENVGGVFGFPPLPDAPQLGGGDRIEVNDRRALNAVWRNGSLYSCATINPNAGIDAGQTTAHWWRVDTSVPMPGLVCADQGNVGADADLGPGTYTFFPSVMIDNTGNMAIGFSASNASIYCGAYYATRFSNDPPGFIGETCPLAPGTDYYLRTFGGPRNRWGDYSGIALCPVDQETFWVFNEYACERGIVIGGEDGRWCTKVGYFQKRPMVLDIRPGSCPNPFNVKLFEFAVGSVQDKGGVLPVAVFGGSDFDASDIDVATISLEGVAPLTRGGGPIVQHLGAPADDGCTCGGDEPEADGYLDLSLKFSSRQIAAAITPGVPGEERTLTLTGQLVDGTPLVLQGCIRFVGEPSRDAKKVSLSAAYPNPFNPVTRIEYYLPVDTRVRLAIYNIKGELVATLIDRVVESGRHRSTWDAKGVASGLYFYRLTAGEFSSTRKMILLK
ncbi:MAG: T9SS type A sorting domain-containing protein, partial [Candidatus Krumholzibacteria bacterium]|nr:T9SS type A sorting domain-containing protein [Candidatus Krumholzibacteria bacterium]